MKNIILTFLSIFIIAYTSAYAQSGSVEKIDQKADYYEIINDGQKLYKNKQYGKAIRTYFTAYTSEYKPKQDTVQIFINQCIKALDKERKAAIKAKKAADEINQKLIAAIKKSTEAEVAEEEAKAEAKAAGITAESMRLSSKAADALLKNNKQEALLLAFAGIKLSTLDYFTEGWEAFGKVVRDSFTQPLYQERNKINGLYILGNKPTIGILNQQYFKLINLEKKELLETSPTIIATSENNSLFAVRSDNKQIQIWNTDGLIDTVQGLSKKILYACFSTNGQYFFVSYRKSPGFLININSKKTIQLEGHSGNIYQARFSPTDQNLMTRASDGHVRVWDMEGENIGVLGKDEVYIHDAAFDVQGNHIVTASAIGLTKFWDIKGSLIRELSQHNAPVKEVAIIANGDKTLARAEDVKITAFSEKDETIDHEEKITGFQVNHAGTHILTWAGDHSVKLTNLATGDSIIFAGHSGILIHAEFSKNDKYILTTTDNGHSFLWNHLGHVVVSWDLETDKPVPTRFTPDQQYILTITENNEMLNICPVPETIFKNMNAKIETYDKAFGELKTNHNLSYVQEIK